MAKKVTLKDNVTDEILYPQTIIDAVYDEDGKSLRNLNKAIQEVDDKFNAYSNVNRTNWEFLGHGALNNLTHTIVASSSTTTQYVYYYSVVAGTYYHLSTTSETYEQSDAFGFSSEVPTITGTYDKSLLTADAPASDVLFVPDEDGYLIIFEYRQGNASLAVSSEINIPQVASEVGSLRVSVDAIEAGSIVYTRVEDRDLTLLGNGYMSIGGLIIMEWENATLYYYPVSANNTYHISSTFEWYEQYAAAGFSRDIPQIGGDFDEAILSAEEPKDTYYTPATDGYVILTKRSDRQQAYIATKHIYGVRDSYNYTDISFKAHFQNYIIVTNENITVLGNAYLNRLAMMIYAFAGSAVSYYPVSKGITYMISSTVNWYENYDAVGFTTNTPVIGEAYTDTVLSSATPVKEAFYTPAADGYLLLVTRGGRRPDVYLPQDEEISLRELKEEVSNLERDDAAVTQYPLKKSIVCSGSSITWGAGQLDSSMVTYVDKYLKDTFSNIVPASKMVYTTTATTITNALLYGSTGKKVEGVGSVVEFDMFSNELALCQVKRRSTDYGIMKVMADGVQIGIFDNKNEIGHDEESFTGTSIKEIQLSHPCTFNHEIYINGSGTPLDNVVINTNRSSIPAGCNAWVFRGPKGDGSETCHYIQFADELGDISSVTVSYDYGRVIAHERSTLGQTQDEWTNEYVYGKGDVSYDPDQPTTGVGSGMEFRAIDRRAFFIHKFNEYKNRHYRIEIIDGVNPYFIVNFAASRYHNLMNAGIGGWQLTDLLYRHDKICHWTQLFKYSHPDILFEEAMTNDDWEFKTRRISRSIGEVTLSDLQKMHQLEVGKITYNSITDKYAVWMCTGIISSITPTSLISSDIIGTQTQVGDIIRIGNYHGDMHQVVCRKITEVNLTTGEVKWLEPLDIDNMLMVESLSDLVGAEINIRNLDTYKQYYQDFINRVHSVSPNTKIVVVHNGLPNLWTRNLWGYDVVHAELCKENENVDFINTQEHIYDSMFNTITGTTRETVESAGAASYDLEFAGTQYSGWQGFKVLVNGIDVYGKDAYVEMDMAYRINTGLSGSVLNKSNCYDRSKCGWNRTGAAFTLHFVKNIPSESDTIEVQYADTIWSADFCHPSDLGMRLYAESYCDYLKATL